jgi:hypothetical protein
MGIISRHGQCQLSSLSWSSMGFCNLLLLRSWHMLFNIVAITEIWPTLSWPLARMLWKSESIVPQAHFHHNQDLLHYNPCGSSGSSAHGSQPSWWFPASRPHWSFPAEPDWANFSNRCCLKIDRHSRSTSHSNTTHVLVHTLPPLLALGWLPMLQHPKALYRAQSNGP